MSAPVDQQQEDGQPKDPIAGLAEVLRFAIGHRDLWTSITDATAEALTALTIRQQTIDQQADVIADLVRENNELCKLARKGIQKIYEDSPEVEAPKATESISIFKDPITWTPIVFDQASGVWIPFSQS